MIESSVEPDLERGLRYLASVIDEEARARAEEAAWLDEHPVEDKDEDREQGDWDGYAYHVN